MRWSPQSAHFENAVLVSESWGPVTGLRMRFHILVAIYVSISVLLLVVLWPLTTTTVDARLSFLVLLAGVLTVSAGHVFLRSLHRAYKDIMGCKVRLFPTAFDDAWRRIDASMADEGHEYERSNVSLFDGRPHEGEMRFDPMGNGLTVRTYSRDDGTLVILGPVGAREDGEWLKGLVEDALEAD